MSIRIRIAVLRLSASLLAGSLHAQDLQRDMALPVENVRYDYAQVLSVRPIYQVLREAGTERVCDARDATKSAPLARVMNAVRDRLTNGGDQNCREVSVMNESRRVIAYDVDYMYRGTKFRTRMDKDPGYRLRIRISISPHPVE